MAELPEAGSFGELLRLVRHRSGLTQQQLADLATLSVRTIRDLESGRVRAPRSNTVRLLAKQLRMSGLTWKGFEELAAKSRVLGRPANGDSMQGTGRHGKSRNALISEIAGIWRRSGGPVLWLSPPDVGFPADSHYANTVSLLESGAQDSAGKQESRLEFMDLSKLREVIGVRPALLILDGFDEHLPRAEQVVHLLQECPSLRVLATWPERT